MTKKILKIFLISFLSLIVAVFYSLSFLVFASPSFMSKKFDDVGMNNLAYICYDRCYRNSQKVDELYLMFNKAIDVNLSTNVAYYGDKLLNNENYNSLILLINLENSEKTENYLLNNSGLNENAKKRLQISTFSEDNYIKNQYVKSLLDTNRSAKAKEFVFKEIDEIMKNNGFGEYSSVCALSYVEKIYSISDGDVQKLENFYTQFVLHYDIDFNHLTLKDFVCEQRLCELAQAISKGYKLLKNEKQAQNWQNISNAHYEVIYG